MNQDGTKAVYESSNQLGRVANLYVGALSKKTHLEICGITLATEGDICRDHRFIDYGERWTVDMLSMARSEINATG